MRFVILIIALFLGVFSFRAVPPPTLPAFPGHPAISHEHEFCEGALHAQLMPQQLMAAQGPGPTPEPPVLPEGQFCEPPTQTQQHPDHPCACHRQCAGTPEDPTTIEDPKCAQYCHKDHCACKTVCD